MTYDLSTPLDKERFKRRCNALYKKGAIVECSEVKAKRTLNQNSYLHAILGEFAMQVGERVDYVKREYFKVECNRDIFERENYDKRLKRNVKMLRSSRELTTEEMTTAINRFRNWAAEGGIYLPEAGDDQWIAYIQREMRHLREWL